MQMWKSFVGMIVAFLASCLCLGGLEATGAEASATFPYTTTNVFRERPLIQNSLGEQNRKLSETPSSFYQNTYNPWAKADSESEATALSKNIPWGAINIVVVTDVHSWIAGNHQDDPRHWPYDAHRSTNQDADYGDVLSFYRRLQELVQDHNNNNNNNNNNNSNQKRDLFLVMNGDFVDGTGFSGYPPTHLAPLLQHMPWDVVNVGNHELYHDETIQYIIDQQQGDNNNPSGIHRWNHNGYLSSNTVLTNTNTPTHQPMTGNRYTYLEGQHTNTTILAFGFLYDFDEGGDLTSHVTVQDTIREDWFLTVLGEDAPRDFDAILVLAHMDCLHPLVQVILDGIRSALPLEIRNTMPIQFVTGHTHRRCHSQLDASAESFEAGRFLDTIGFVSLDTISTNHDDLDMEESSHGIPSSVFRHRFLDANRKSMHEILVTEHQAINGDKMTSYSYDFDQDFGTPEGRALTLAIRKTQSQLGLDEVLGCSPQTYGIFEDPEEGTALQGQTATTTLTATKENNHNDPSLWDLYLHQMLPKQLLEPIHRFDNAKNSGEPVFVSGTGVLRYSIFEGPVTVNDVIAISPFNDTIYELVAFEDEDVGEESLPIDGWQLLGWLEAANELYATAGEYGLPTFVLSTLSSAGVPITSAPKTIDPQKVYRIFATDYDAYRLLSVVANVKEIEHGNSAVSFSFANGILYQSRLVYPNGQKPEDEDCYYLTELWKAFIREQMPCDTVEGHPSLRWGGSGNHYNSLDDSLLSTKAQILQSPSAASAKVHSRMTPAQEDLVLASDQKAAAMLVVVAFAMIVYLMIYPPEQQPEEIRRSQRNGQEENPTSRSAEPKEAFHHCRDHESDGAVSLQLIPLRRYNTGNLSEGSYGSI